METQPLAAPAHQTAGLPAADAAVVASIQRGRREDFAILVRRYMPNVRRLLSCRHGLRGQDLDEAAHQTFVEAYLSLPRLRDPERFAGFLFAIVRRTPAPKRPFVRQGADPVAPEAEDDAWRDALTRAIARLPESMQELLALKYSKDLTAEQISARLGLATGTVTKSLSRAYEQLRNDADLKAYFTGD